MSLGDHLRELRKRLVISAVAIVVGAIIAFVDWSGVAALLRLPFQLSSLTDFVKDGMRVPITKIAEDYSATISYTTVSAAFDLHLQIGLTVAILIASPIWLFQIFAFLVPGLARSLGQSMRIFRSEVKTMKDENGNDAPAGNSAADTSTPASTDSPTATTSTGTTSTGTTSTGSTSTGATKPKP